MVRVIEKFLSVLGLLKGLDSESTFEVVRHLISRWGENKIVLFDPRISHADRNKKINDIKLIKLNIQLRSKERLDDLI